ncbi:hypothetical protein UFOVP1604_31 [uncultured Caudovirales phage]|uniref:Uncharacterized protein n=1 Tax=uncultured Caudovirales phage TaxID=2100421 RepID=A0A6J5SSZ0_9CAUD|nr:hypothetical protein UFOVP1604_31 [uncultured Caudovirales phage]
MKLVKTFENFMHSEPDTEIGHKATIIEIPQQAAGIDHEAHHEVENYMFFSNLETIQRLIKIMLEMDPMKVDQLLKNGHNWAEDHITSSKDDIEEVADFLMGEMTEKEVQESSTKAYSCNECGTMYEAHEINEDHTCSCGSKLEENWG